MSCLDNLYQVPIDEGTHTPSQISSFMAKRFDKQIGTGNKNALDRAANNYGRVLDAMGKEAHKYGLNERPLKYLNTPRNLIHTRLFD